MKEGLVFKARFSLEDGKGQYRKRFISCGDYHWWDIVLFREAIISRYGQNAVSQMQEDAQGCHYFEHIAEVDFDLITDDLGVKHSSPSTSSSSSSRES